MPVLRIPVEVIQTLEKEFAACQSCELHVVDPLYLDIRRGEACGICRVARVIQKYASVSGREFRADAALL